MRPEDVSAFRHLKNNWYKAILSFRRENQNFANVLNKAVNNLNSIKKGFGATGMNSWNASPIEYSECLGRKSNQINDDYYS